MTPQQKLERLKEIGLEAQQILSSMDSKDAMRVVALDISKRKVGILLSDENDFVTLFPDCQVEQIESPHFDKCLTHRKDGIEYTTFAGGILA